MTRMERIAPFLDKLSEEEFDEFLSAASYAASTTTVYDAWPDAEKEMIATALARLDAGQGVDLAEVKARIAARLKSAGT